MYNWAPYDAATGCVPHPHGAKALAAYLEDRFPYQFSLGICNCRDVRGGTSWSHHAECRAYDCGIPTNSGAYRPELGDPIIELLGPHGKRLGLDHVILNRVIYSAKSPDGRPYTGVHPHYNHAHIGLHTIAADSLTYATLVSVLGTPTNGGDDDVEQVYKDLQQGLKDAGYYTGTIDGLWGPNSKAAYSAMCKDAKKTVDAYTKTESNVRYATRSHPHTIS
jgi:hypothetical protein